MTTSYTSLLGLAQPQTGDLSGTWGDVVNDNITAYLDAAIAGTQIISGTATAVTLSKTTGANLSQVGSGSTGSSQYQIIRCTGTPASLLTITAPATDKTYIIINATAQSVKIVGAGPTTGVTITAGSNAIVAWNGSDFVNLTPAVSGFLALSGGTMTGAITFAAAQTVDGTNPIGYINIPQNSQSAAYTLVAADAGKHIFHPSTDANARTFTIPADSSVAYPIGTAISFVNMTSQVVSIAITTDTMYLAGTGTIGTRSLAQYGTATALKIESNKWIISGAGLT